MAKGWFIGSVVLSLWGLASSSVLAQQPGQALQPLPAGAATHPVIGECLARLDPATGRMRAECGMQMYTPAEDLADLRTLAALRPEFPISVRDLRLVRVQDLGLPPANEPWPPAVRASQDAAERWKRWEEAQAKDSKASKGEFFARVSPEAVVTLPVRGLPVGSPWMERVVIREGGSLDVEIRSVSAAQGMSWPDPELWVIRTDGNFDPETGQVIAHVDDVPGGLPGVSLRGLAGGTYRIIVSAYSQSSGGWMSIRVSVDGAEVLAEEASAFGGLALRYADVSQGESLFAGAYGKSGAIRHDTILVLLPLSGVLPGPYVASNNALGLLPRVEARQPISEALLLVGSFVPDQRPRAKIIRPAGNPGNPERRDLDGDGLVWEVEKLLGTCDGVEDATARRCRSPLPVPWGWSPADTDNDGATDLEEVFGIRRCFASAPQPPLFWVPSCITGKGGRCASVCSAGAYVIDLPWSAMGSPLPTRHDVYLELDWWTHELPATKPALETWQIDRLVRSLANRWSHGGKEVPGFVKGSPVVKLHVYLDDIVGGPPREGSAHIPAAGMRYLFFDAFFEPGRRYSGLFFYVLAKSSGAGQSDVSGRSAIIGVGRRGVAVTNLLHELGHLLGLQHNGQASVPTNTPFYLSIMSYAYAHSLPPPLTWDGTAEACSAKGACSGGFKCVAFKGKGSFCLPDCGAQDVGAEAGVVFERLSTGELSLPTGTSESAGIPEEGYPEWFIPYYYCASLAREGGKERLGRILDGKCPDGRCVQCEKGLCRIDWNHDGVFAAAPADVDGDGTLSDMALGDMDDASRIVELGRRGPWTMVRRWAAFFYASFEDHSSGNLLPYPMEMKWDGDRRVVDPTNRCNEVDKWRHCKNESRGHAFWFPSVDTEVAGAQITSAEGYCMPLSEGTTLSIRVRPLGWSQEGAVLLDSGSVQLGLEGTGKQSRWVARVNWPGGRQELEIPDAGAVGRWSRLTLRVDAKAGRMEWHVRRESEHLVAKGEVPGIRLGDLCRWSLGSALGEGAKWQGMLDDPIWVAGPVPEM